MISTVVHQNREDCVCVVGNYNNIRIPSEHRGRSEAQNRRDIDKFDGFIRGSNLLDMPLHGRKFTYYKPDDTCKSRLDRALINNEWLSQWPSASLKDLFHTVSAYCPISNQRFKIRVSNHFDLSMLRLHIINSRVLLKCLEVLSDLRLGRVQD